MTFNLVQNNVRAKIENPLDSTDTLLIMGEGKETLLGADFSGDASKNLRGTLAKFENGVLVQQEIVNVTAKSGKNFTMTRAYEACPLNDSATVQSQVAYDFASGDYIYFNLTAAHINEIGTRLKTVEDDKLDKADFDALSEPFQASSEGDDDYQMDDPATTGYVNGKAYRVQADVANTGVATLEINGLGPKALKKTSSGAFNNLETGDIIADQIFTATYISNQDCFQYQQDLATAVIPPASSTLEKEVTYGETITAPRVLSKGRPVDGDSNLVSNTFAYFRYNNTSSYDQAHSFLIGSGRTLSSLTLKMYKTGSPNYDIKAEVYSDAGFTTLVDTSTNTISTADLDTGSGGKKVTFNFNGIAEDGTYYVKLSYDGSTYDNTSNYVRIITNNASVYADGHSYYITEAGAVTAQTTIDWWFEIGEFGDNDKVFLTDPRNTQSMKQIVGISKTSGVADDVKSITQVGVSGAFSSLEAWKSYYAQIPLEAATDYDINQEDSNSTVRVGYNTAEKGHGNSFVFNGDQYNIDDITVKIYNNHTSNTYKYYIRIYKDGVQVAESDEYDSTPLGSDTAGYETTFTFPETVKITGEGYMWILEAETFNTTYFLYMRMNTTNVYSGGELWINNNGTLSILNANYDAWFKINGTIQNRYTLGTPVSSDIDQTNDNTARYIGYNTTYRKGGGLITNPASNGFYDLDEIKMKLYRQGTISSWDYIIDIYSKDTGQVVAESDPLDLSALPTTSSGTVTAFTFPANTLIEGDFYFMLRRSDNSNNTSNFVYMRLENTGAYYGGGTHRVDSGGTIYSDDATADPYFEITGSEVDKVVSLGEIDLEASSAGSVRIGKAISSTELWLADFSEEASVGAARNAKSKTANFYVAGAAEYSFTVTHGLGSVPKVVLANFKHYINSSIHYASAGSWDGKDQTCVEAGYTYGTIHESYIGHIEPGSSSDGYYIILDSIDDQTATFRCVEQGTGPTISIYGNLTFIK